MNGFQHIIIGLVFHIACPVHGRSATMSDDNQCRGISRGREFVAAFTSNLEQRRSELHIIVVAFSDNPTTVTISSQYRVNGVSYQTSFELPPRGYIRTTIPIEFLLDPNSDRSDKVLTITASSEVTVYGMNYEDFTTDAFLALPNNQLGTQYVVVSVLTAQNGRGFGSLFAVIGLEDDTNVDVTLTDQVTFGGNNYMAGDLVSFEVDRHEVVQISGRSDTDLSGTIIRSDQAVAVYSGHVCSATPDSTCDILSEQLIPVDSWGKTHIYTAPYGSFGYETTYIIAAFLDNTIVSVPGFSNRSLNAGNVWEVSLAGNGVISSTLPSSVTQVLRYINRELVDPSITQVPSEEHFAFKFGFATPPKSGEDPDGFFNFVNIVVKANECSTVTINSQTLQCNDTAMEVPGSEYVVVAKALPKGEGVYFIEHSSRASLSPMSVIVYGYERDETYGYAAGLSLPNEGRLLSVKPFVVNENGCELLTTTLPCLERSFTFRSTPTCRFRNDMSFLEVEGVLNEFYQVMCPTPRFDHVGLTSVDVSLDNGKTFPYSDTIYVASQYILTPRVSIGGTTAGFGFIDLTVRGSVVTIFWDPNAFHSSKVDIGILVDISNNQNVQWSEEIKLASKIPNSGEFDSSRSLFQVAQVLYGEVESTILNAVFIVRSSGRRVATINTEGSILAAKSAQIQLKIVPSDEAECALWESVLVQGFARLSQLPPCPTDLEFARNDPRYQPDNADVAIYHPGAAACYQRHSDNNAQTQCCYGSNGELLLDAKAGGTASAYAPDRFVSTLHIRYDILPWIACCYLGNAQDCEWYYSFRLSVTNRGYQPPTPTRGMGDPHFITPDLHEYTFNAVGEFILLESDLNNVTFQARMEQIPGRNASVFSAFVLQAESVPKIQIERSPLKRTTLLIDNKELQIIYGNETIPQFSFGGMQLNINPDQTKVLVRLRFGLTVSFVVLPGVMMYTLDLDDSFRGKVRGLLGNFNGVPDDDFTLPSGDMIPHKSSLRNVHHEFGEQWRVNKSTTIFKYLSSTSYEFYNDEDFVPNFDLPDPDDVSQEINDLCGSSFQCRYDAVVTSDLEFANRTLTDVVTYHEKREVFNRVVDCKYPTGFENGVVENAVYYVGSSYTLSCQSGFILVGNGEAFCGSNGNWSTSFPKCVSVWVVVVVGASGLLTLVLFTMMICCVWKKCSSPKMMV